MYHHRAQALMVIFGACVAVLLDTTVRPDDGVGAEMAGAIQRDQDPAISIGVVLKEDGVAGGVMDGEKCRFQGDGIDIRLGLEREVPKQPDVMRFAGDWDDLSDFAGFEAELKQRRREAFKWTTWIF